MFFKKRIFKKKKNRMRNDSNLLQAREYFFTKKNKNLHFLLKNRFNWMNNYIKNGDNVIELGSGAGLLKEFININIKTSDLSDYEYFDYKNIDACDINLPDKTFDVVISSNLIHHIAYPLKHFREVHRILKPQGLYLVQDANCSFFLQLICIIMNHGGFDCTVDVKNEKIPCSNPNDPFAENSAVPSLIFDHYHDFNKQLNFKFELINNRFSEFFIFLNSGGVTAKTFYLPLNDYFLDIFLKLDKILVKFHKIFALQRSVVLKKL